MINLDRLVSLARCIQMTLLAHLRWSQDLIQLDLSEVRYLEVTVRV